MQEFISNSVSETESFAFDFAKTLKSGDVVAFEGNLGAGKTAFVRGMARALGDCKNVSSPTFAIVNEYDTNPPIFHFDMYRIETMGELYSIGFFDYLDRGGILAIEWSENIYTALPDDAIFVCIENLSENQRKITIKEGKS